MFESLYPSSDINLTVRDTVNWTTEISPFGQGWGDLLSGIQNLRYQITRTIRLTTTAFLSLLRAITTIATSCIAGLTLWSLIIATLP